MNHPFFRTDKELKKLAHYTATALNYDGPPTPRTAKNDRGISYSLRVGEGEETIHFDPSRFYSPKLGLAGVYWQLLLKDSGITPSTRSEDEAIWLSSMLKSKIGSKDYGEVLRASAIQGSIFLFYAGYITRDKSGSDKVESVLENMSELDESGAKRVDSLLSNTEDLYGFIRKGAMPLRLGDRLAETSALHDQSLKGHNRFIRSLSFAIGNPLMLLYLAAKDYEEPSEDSINLALRSLLSDENGEPRASKGFAEYVIERIKAAGSSIMGSRYLDAIRNPQ